MSDSDDNEPISSLKRPAPEAKPSKDDSSDDDTPISQLAKKQAAKAGAAAKKAPVVAAADSDDDLPLADLKKKVAKAKATPAAKAKAAPAKSKTAKLVTKKGSKKTTPTAKKGESKSPNQKTPVSKGKTAAPKKKASTKKKAPTKKTPTPKKKAARSKEQDQASGEKFVTRSGVLNETRKGELVQKLLCRWWYAMDWPAKEDIIQAPSSYEALEGYPGVYVCVEGDDIGKLLDNRNKSTCPCYANFSNKSSEELKRLLEIALSKQKAELITHWGQGVEEEAKIDKELKWLKTVDAAKADKAAARALSQAQMTN